MCKVIYEQPLTKFWKRIMVPFPRRFVILLLESMRGRVPESTRDCLILRHPSSWTPAAEGCCSRLNLGCRSATERVRLYALPNLSHHSMLFFFDEIKTQFFVFQTVTRQTRDNCRFSSRNFPTKNITSPAVSTL